MKTKLFVIAIMVVILVTCLCLPVFAYADYNDLDENTIVNFNQYIKIESATNPANTFTDNSITVGENILSRVNVTPFSLLSNHKYYLKSNVTSETMFYLGNGYSQYYGFYTRIITSGTTETINSIVISADSTLNTEFYFSVIDLTQMFGADTASSMTVDDCQEIFVADYYAYNTGTTISFNGLNSYAQGVQDTLDSFVVSFNADIIGSLGYAYNYDGLQSDFYYNSQFSAYYFNNFFALPVGSIPANSQIEIYTQFLQGENAYFQVYYKLNDSLVLASSEKIQYQTYNDYSSELSSINVFSIPYVVDTLYFCVSTNSASYSGITSDYAIKSEMTFKTLDVSTLVSASFVRGSEYYKTYYSYGHDGYNSIYDVGYTDGLNDTNPYTFGYLMSSVIEAPLNAILGIFNFDFLGVNFKNMITLVITLCVIIAIVRLFMGGD